ncbi:MAG: RNA polymerase subunit sigma-70 [Deltaproteobacteria bacterium]|nr:RNA polymerase subunit sigma-70 [Deltaproteobacteria bacterium]
MEELEAHRPALVGHCYRMLGSAVDADDAVQEVMVRAWRHRDSLAEDAKLGAWLHRIATRVCLTALAERHRRTRPMVEQPAGTPTTELTTREASHWIEPIPDALVIPDGATPLQQVTLRERVRLAFVTALQQLPPKQRAALLLVEVVGLSATETADALETSVPSVNSALQRARAKLEQLGEAPSGAQLTDSQRALVDRFVAAFVDYDPDQLTALMHEDAALSMPPYELWLQGHESLREWFRTRGSGCHGSRLVPTSANGSPAFLHYRAADDGGHAAWALVVLELRGERIEEMANFLDVEAIFPLFDAPLRLPPTR